MYISITTTILSNWRTYSFIATMENVFISSFFVRLDSMTLLLSHYMYTTTYRTQSVSKMRYYTKITWYVVSKKKLISTWTPKLYDSALLISLAILNLMAFSDKENDSFNFLKCGLYSCCDKVLVISDLSDLESGNTKLKKSRQF